MLITFMKQDCRFIQARHDGQNLVFHKANLYNFSQIKTAPFDLFVQYLASTPQGGTTKFTQQANETQLYGIH